MRLLFKICLLLLTALCLGAPASAHAQQLIGAEDGFEFHDYFVKLAEEIQYFLDNEKKGDKSVAVVFNGPPAWQSSGGNRLVEELKSELARHKIRVQSPSNYAFKGEYKVTPTGKLHITGQLIDKFGVVPPRWIAMPPCADPNPRILAEIMGLSVDLPPRSRIRPDKAVIDSFVNPKVAVTSDTLARPSATSPFGVRVLVNKQPRKITNNAGLAFVDLKLDESYELEIVNESKNEIAAPISVDGLSVFHFSTLRQESGEVIDQELIAPPRFRYYIFAGGSSGLVQGWEKDATRVRAFKITPFEESAAVQSGQTTSVGMITVSFHACWDKDKSRPPADEDRTVVMLPNELVEITKEAVTLPTGQKSFRWIKGVLATSSDSPPTKIGTGFGQDILVGSQGVTREIGASRGLVTIRYTRSDPNKK